MLGCGKTEPLQFVRLDMACHVFHSVHWNSGLPASVWRTSPSVQLYSFTSHNLVDLQQYKKCEFKYQESINNNNEQLKVNIPEMRLAHQVPLTLPKNSQVKLKFIYYGTCIFSSERTNATHLHPWTLIEADFIFHLFIFVGKTFTMNFWLKILRTCSTFTFSY